MVFYLQISSVLNLNACFHLFLCRSVFNFDFFIEPKKYIYTQWPWVSSQNWLTLRRLQNFKYILRCNNLKTNNAVYLIFSTLYCLSIMNSVILDLHENLVIQRSDMSFT